MKKEIMVSAPSNIALIKYMGKWDQGLNLATNSSLSWTLNHLRSFVRLSQPTDSNRDEWRLLPGYEPMELSGTGREKFLNHVKRLKAHFGLGAQTFLVESANDFPSDCGLASSASSFAALTKAFYSWVLGEELSQEQIVEMAFLSKQGSGSSVRSFLHPWCLWHTAKHPDKKGEEKIQPLLSAHFNDLLHAVVVVSGQVKSVSSSQAHRRVTSSLVFGGRVERAEQRLQEMIGAIAIGDWQSLRNIAWEEFWDMHGLFVTSRPSFSYMTPLSLKVLDFFQEAWELQNDGPIVTMDAGPNVHLLYRLEQKELAERQLKELNKSPLKILTDARIKL